MKDSVMGASLEGKSRGFLGHAKFERSIQLLSNRQLDGYKVQGRGPG